MSDLIDELLADAGERMTLTVESTNSEFATIRTGRASSALLDRVMVDYYEVPTPLNQLATINAPEARLLTVQPFDISSIKLIEKAIMDSDIGLTPNNDGKLIRLSIPELNEERRVELVKIVRAIAEEGRIAIRNVRRDVMGDLRDQLPEHGLIIQRVIDGKERDGLQIDATLPCLAHFREDRPGDGRLLAEGVDMGAHR